LRLCSAITKAGAPCQRPAQGHNEFCLGHDPAKATERRRMASRGGRGKTNQETRSVKKLIDQLTAKVLSGDVEPAVCHAVVALQNIKLRAIELERRLEETDVRQEMDELHEVLRESGII
jgi:hypothetical protein